MTDQVIPHWQSSLSRQLDGLGRWFQGRYFQAAGQADSVVPATRFFAPQYLLEAVAATSDLRLRETDGWHRDIAVAASRFARRYASSLSAIALTGLAHGIGLDVSPDRCSVVVTSTGLYEMSVRAAEDEIWQCAQRPTDWRVAGPKARTVAELRQYVWFTLFGKHIAPLFHQLAGMVKASEALLWTSAGEYAGMLADAAEEYLPADQAHAYLADRDALFDADHLPGVPGANPLRGSVSYAPVEGDAFPRTVQTRGLCCLNYLLEDRLGMLCQNCPHLPLEQRAAMVRERHGNPRGTPQGPAAQRSVEIGLRRPSLRHRLGQRQPGN